MLTQQVEAEGLPWTGDKPGLHHETQTQNLFPRPWQEMAWLLQEWPFYIHMSKGFVFLALALCLILLPTMFLSFRPVCRRLKTIDFIFSFLSIVIGTLSFLNQVRTWSYSIPSMERRLSYFRWASRHHSLHLQQQTIMDRNLESVQKLSAVTSFVNSHGALQQSDSSTTQGTDESPWPDSSTSVPVAQFRSDLP